MPAVWRGSVAEALPSGGVEMRTPRYTTQVSELPVAVA